jgi:DNA-binding transcriptional ArsR family regulator
MTNHVTALTALADPTRREIFERLTKSPSAVGDLARDLPVSRPAVSQHLKVLKSAGLVTDYPDGTRRIYSIDPTGIAAIREYFEQFWQQSLARFRAVASQAVTSRAGASEGAIRERATHSVEEET